MNVGSNNSSFIFLISWVFYFLNFTLFCVGEESCQLHDVFSNHCGEHALCSQLKDKENVGVCKCIESYQFENGKCVQIPAPHSHSSNDEEHPQDISSGSSAALWIVIPCFIVILGGALFFMIKRLKLVEKLYQFRVRRYNTVFVTSLQDDDAPIT